MTSDQFAVAARLAAIESEPLLMIARAVLVDGSDIEHAPQRQALRLEDAKEAIVSIERAAIAIRSAFVIHSPAEFRILVGHSDFHRMPGALSIEVGQVVHLVACTAERRITVRVDRVPETTAGYFEGVVIAPIARGGRFFAGDRVQFGEDQVDTPAAKRQPFRIARRRPL